MNELRAKNWPSAVVEVEYLLSWKSFETLPLAEEVIALCRKVIETGFVKEFLVLLDSRPSIRRRLRPLIEALKAVEAGSDAILRDVAPEVREPAAQFYKLLT